jgi:hypothetical protein
VEDIVAAARLTALIAVLAGAALASAQEVPRTAGIALMVGWTGAVLLAVGLVVGYRGAVSVAAVAFVLRAAILSGFEQDLTPPLWAQAALIVLMVEMASASLSLRARPADPGFLVLRGVAVALGAAAVVEALGLALDGAEASGILVRIVGVVALVAATGWVTRIWRKSGLRA